MLENYISINQNVAWLPNLQRGKRSVNPICSEDYIYFKTPGFLYIPFVPNEINFATLPSNVNFDVLSYNFSGCIMAVCVDKCGILKACHVSTGAGQDCIPLWNQIKSNVYRFMEFKPSDYIKVPIIRPLLGCYGLITGNINAIRCFSITVVRDGRLPRVEWIEEIRNMDWRTNH